MTADTASVYDLGTPGRTADIILAEKAILGSAIRSGDVTEAMISLLPSEDCFSDTVHQAVYSAVRWLAEMGERVEPTSVLARLVEAEQGEWRTSRAGLILADLAEHASPSWEHHARRVLKAAARRRGLLALERARRILTEPGAFDPETAADEIRVLLDAALAPATTDTGLARAADLFGPALDRLQAGKPPGIIRFPWLDLRRLVPWLRPGQLVTVAARPSLGKSLLGQDLARYVAFDQQIPAILFTIEQDRDEVMDRFIAAEAGVLLQNVTESKLDDGEWERVAAAHARFAESKLIIDDSPKISPAHIRARLRGVARSEPAQLAVVDYLQLMDGAEGENRQREVSALVASLKAIAREFRIPVVMLCQLNRGPESRHDKRPYLSDARESGAVENDSDVAILIHRPDHYEFESGRAGEADLIVDKNRNGPRGVVTVGFQGYYARFVDLAPPERFPAPQSSTPDPRTAPWDN